MPTKLVLLVNALFWVVLCACSSTQTFDSLQSKTDLGTDSTTPLHEMTSSPAMASETLPSTNTPTFQRTKTATNTETIIPPSSTPESTLLPKESKELFLSLMQTNGGCGLPCVWGITPGISEFDNVREFVARFGNGTTDHYEIEGESFENTNYIFFYFCDEENFLRRSYKFEQLGKPVEYLLLSAIERVGRPDHLLEQEISYYKMANILTMYGKPAEVFIGPWWDDPHLVNEWLSFGVVLYYPERGFLIQYLFNQDKDEEFFIGCPDPVMQFFLTTWDYHQDKSLEEVSSVQSEFYVFREDSAYYQPIEMAMDMTIDEFYEKYKDPETQTCLRAPRKNWNYGYLVTKTPKP
jgi:hypothetical protein